ncbi:Hypothetical protein POVN_LOCUS450 [uncultured virus]|nr:Hypothetical protein POVN_LOCUS450 [uncultured virus]
MVDSGSADWKINALIYYGPQTRTYTITPRTTLSGLLWDLYQVQGIHRSRPLVLDYYDVDTSRWIETPEEADFTKAVASLKAQGKTKVLLRANVNAYQEGFLQKIIPPALVEDAERLRRGERTIVLRPLPPSTIPLDQSFVMMGSNLDVDNTPRALSLAGKEPNTDTMLVIWDLTTVEPKPGYRPARTYKALRTYCDFLGPSNFVCDIYAAPEQLASENSQFIHVLGGMLDMHLVKTKDVYSKTIIAGMYKRLTNTNNFQSVLVISADFRLLSCVLNLRKEAVRRRWNLLYNSPAESLALANVWDHKEAFDVIYKGLKPIDELPLYRPPLVRTLPVLTPKEARRAGTGSILPPGSSKPTLLLQSAKLTPPPAHVKQTLHVSHLAPPVIPSKPISKLSGTATAFIPMAPVQEEPTFMGLPLPDEGAVLEEPTFMGLPLPDEGEALGGEEEELEEEELQEPPALALPLPGDNDMVIVSGSSRPSLSPDDESTFGTTLMELTSLLGNTGAESALIVAPRSAGRTWPPTAGGYTLF